MTDEEFEQQVRDKQHSEILKALRLISEVMSKPSAEFEAIVKSNESICEAVSKLKIELPEINLPDNAPVIQAVENLSKEVSNGNLLIQKLINKQPTEYEFSFVRNNFTDLIQKVIAKPIK